MIVYRKKIKDNGTQKAVQRQRMGILLCEQNFREVWRRNENVRAEIGQILHTHTRCSISSKDKLSNLGISDTAGHKQPHNIYSVGHHNGILS